MSARYALAWSTGASIGLLVGAVLGQSVRDQRDFRELRYRALQMGATPEERARARAVPPLRRPVPRTPPRTGAETREAGNGAQTGAQWLDQAELHARPDYQEALRRVEGMPWEPGVDLADWERAIAKPAAQRHTARHAAYWHERPTPATQRLFTLDEVAAEFGIDLDEPDEPCRHTLGALTCPFRGPHTAHAYQPGTWAPDRKHDTDEGIE